MDLPISNAGRPGGGFVNGELLVTMKRAGDASAGVGGDPLLFVKPYGEPVTGCGRVTNLRG